MKFFTNTLLLGIAFLSLVVGFEGKKKSCEEFIQGREGTPVCRGENVFYEFYPPRADFFKAERNCVARGGHLTDIVDEEEADFLLQEMESRDIDLAWTGYNDHGSGGSEENTFTYITGIEGYNPVFDDTIIFSSNTQIKDCAALELENDEKFEVHKCGGKEIIHSICKYNFIHGSIIFVTAPRLPDRESTEGFVIMENWGAAREECMAKGGDLVTIGSRKMNNFVKDLLQNMNIHDVWVGQFHDVSTRKFKWASASYSPHRNWCTDEPAIDESSTTPAPEPSGQCVFFLAGQGCFGVNLCGGRQDDGALILVPKQFVCQIGGTDYTEKAMLRDLISVILQKTSEIKKDCQSC
uniref:C-type lectin domain-containing protein n=1 Tax=Clytia hemisphaerica TaxID=252671 RepID=A0A7M5VA60_9CNID